MKTIEIVGKNYFGHWTHERTACRGVIIEDGRVLLSYAVRDDLWMIPGGGLEAGEDEGSCCVRELAEETVETVQEKVQEVTAPQDDGVLTVTVREDKLLYEGQEVTLAQLEENLLKDYKTETAVELKDDHAIKAAYDEVTALLQKLNIPFSTGK